MATVKLDALSWKSWMPLFAAKTEGSNKIERKVMKVETVEIETENE